MSKQGEFDYVVIGSGAAGGTAALMAAGAGLNVALIEADRFGGSAANWRDVPYGAGLHVAHLYAESRLGARFGMSSANLRYNYPTLAHWRETAMRRGGAGSVREFEKAGVKAILGFAHFVNSHEVAVGQGKRVRGRKFLIASGSVPAEHGILGAERALLPETALNLPRMPKSMVVVGAGATGAEVAQYFAELGSSVILVEAAGRILPQEEPEAGGVLADFLTKQLGVKIAVGAKVVAMQADAKGSKVTFEQGGRKRMTRAEAIVLATGTTPALDMGLDNAGVKYDATGIVVNKSLQTSVRHIYAAGDVLGGRISSTEKSSYEGAMATANIVSRNKSATNYQGFARVVDTRPKVASIGLTEEDCIERKVKYKVGVAEANGLTVANITDFSYGMAKIIINRDKKIIGATVVAPEADVLIQELSLAMRTGVSILELASTPHVATGWGELVRVAARKLGRG